jgi:thioredoxin-like negative regulator of GroEL
LLAFVVAFSVPVAVTAWLERSNESTDVNASQMTRSKVHADTALQRSDVDEAALHLSDLLAADPLNSHARFRLAGCYHKKFLTIRQKLALTTSGSEADSLKRAAREAKQNAVLAYRKSQDSLRYRERSGFQLATLHAQSNDREQTLNALRQWLEGERGDVELLSRTSVFDFLKDDPEFWKIVGQLQSP